MQQVNGEVDVIRTAVGLAHTLRAAGVDATHDRVHEFVRSLGVLDPSARDDVYWAGRLVFCAGPDDLDRYDRAFAAYFAGARPRRAARPPRVRTRTTATGVFDGGSPDAAGDDEVQVVTRSASAVERLRHRDVTNLTDVEREQLYALLARFRLPGETRITRRFAPGRRGRIDRHRTVRALLAAGGEPAQLRRQRHDRRPRRVVLLADVSGSMSGYADALLRFAHAALQRRQARTEVFTVGTRLTRVTEALAHRDPELAMRAVSEAIPDWSGGTRLGETLKTFLDDWGQRGVARGAVVVILSDGWERGAPDLLATQMARLGRLAHRVVWANPRKARTGYEPVTAGMAAALPHVDDFVEGHSLGALEHLADVVAGRADA